MMGVVGLSGILGVVDSEEGTALCLCSAPDDCVRRFLPPPMNDSCDTVVGVIGSK